MKYVGYEYAKELIAYVAYCMVMISGVFGLSNWIVSGIRRGIGLLKRFRDNHPAVRKEEHHEQNRHL